MKRGRVFTASVWKVLMAEGVLGKDPVGVSEAVVLKTVSITALQTSDKVLTRRDARPE